MGELGSAQFSASAASFALFSERPEVGNPQSSVPHCSAVVKIPADASTLIEKD